MSDRTGIDSIGDGVDTYVKDQTSMMTDPVVIIGGILSLVAAVGKRLPRLQATTNELPPERCVVVVVAVAVAVVVVVVVALLENVKLGKFILIRLQSPREWKNRTRLDEYYFFYYLIPPEDEF